MKPLCIKKAFRHNCMIVDTVDLSILITETLSAMILKPYPIAVFIMENFSQGNLCQISHTLWELRLKANRWMSKMYVTLALGKIVGLMDSSCRCAMQW